MYFTTVKKYWEEIWMREAKTQDVDLNPHTICKRQEEDEYMEYKTWVGGLWDGQESGSEHTKSVTEREGWNS